MTTSTMTSTWQKQKQFKVTMFLFSCLFFSSSSSKRCRHIPLVILQTVLTSSLCLTQTSHTAPPSARRMGLREATRTRGNVPLPNLPRHRGRLRPTRRPPSRDPGPVPGPRAKAPPLPQAYPGPRRGAANQHTCAATSGTWIWSLTSVHPESTFNLHAVLPSNYRWLIFVI